MPTTNEPTVPVPVSLIENVATLLEGMGWTPVMAADLRALLSQPTPTAEPDPYEYETTTGPRKAWDFADEPPEGDGWELDPDRGRPGESWERFDFHEERYWRRLRRPTATPSIEAVSCADPNVNRWYCHRGVDGTCPLPKCIDPSTIRDVTHLTTGSADA